MVLSGKKRALEGDPQYEPCCNKYTEHTLKDSNLDVKVKGLLVMHAGLKPEPMWRLLCCRGYHTTRKEITNWRGCEKTKQKQVWQGEGGRCCSCSTDECAVPSRLKGNPVGVVRLPAQASVWGECKPAGRQCPIVTGGRRAGVAPVARRRGGWRGTRDRTMWHWELGRGRAVMGCMQRRAEWAHVILGLGRGRADRVQTSRCRGQTSRCRGCVQMGGVQMVQCAQMTCVQRLRGSPANTNRGRATCMRREGKPCKY